jgi:hypothetical protein
MRCFLHAFVETSCRPGADDAPSSCSFPACPRYRNRKLEDGPCVLGAEALHPRPAQLEVLPGSCGGYCRRLQGGHAEVPGAQRLARSHEIVAGTPCACCSAESSAAHALGVAAVARSCARCVRARVTSTRSGLLEGHQNAAGLCSTANVRNACTASIGSCWRAQQEGVQTASYPRVACCGLEHAYHAPERERAQSDVWSAGCWVGSAIVAPGIPRAQVDGRGVGGGLHSMVHTYRCCCAAGMAPFSTCFCQPTEPC